MSGRGAGRKALPRRNPPGGRGVGGGAVHTYLDAGFMFCGFTYSSLAPEQRLEFLTPKRITTQTFNGAPSHAVVVT